MALVVGLQPTDALSRAQETPVKLYSGPLSLFTAKVRIALREKGVDAEIIDVPFGKQGYEPKHPEVLRHNPKAQVPVLVDGELVLTDSTVILEYLEDLRPTPALYPAAAADKARCRQLEHFADEILFPPVFEFVTEIFYKPDATDRDTARLAAAGKRVEELQAELDAVLGERDWFCGEFSVADITIFLVCMFAATLGQPVDAGCARLSAWFERASQRPAIAAEAQQMVAFRASLG